MKVLVALALCGLIAVACADLEAQPEVPVDLKFTPECSLVEGEYATLIGNPDDCATYYICNYGNPVLMNCPTGLHFNDKLKVCDRPATACCDKFYDPHNQCQ